MTPDVFVDMDGVLADFDGFYLAQFGVSTDRAGRVEDGFWDRMLAHGSFFRDMPLMPDARRLWEGVLALHPEPVVLSAAPPEIPDAPTQKKAWLEAHFGDRVPLITCRAKDECRHGKPGDILIDDWPKWRHLWEGMGGTFVLHRSAEDSLAQLAALLRGCRI